MPNDTNTTDTVAAQNAEAANANVGESSALSASATTANQAQATTLTGNTASNSLTGSGSNATTNAADTFIADPTTQQPSTAGTSGVAPGTPATTGMAAGVAPVVKLSPLQAAQQGDNTAPNVNVKTPANAPHPVVHTVSTKVSELRTIINNLEQTPWIQRAGKDLQAFEEWVVQHFEEMKRKG